MRTDFKTIVRHKDIIYRVKDSAMKSHVIA
jgi:hypothetical protein